MTQMKWNLRWQDSSESYVTGYDEDGLVGTYEAVMADVLHAALCRNIDLKKLKPILFPAE